jgi:hypothetical protein
VASRVVSSSSSSPEVGRRWTAIGESRRRQRPGPGSATSAGGWRARSGYQTRLRALTAEGRQSARLLAFLPGAFFLLAMASDPSYARTLIGDAGGRTILFVAIGLWGFGLLWTRRLVRPLR